MATFPQFSTAPSFLSGGNYQTTVQQADPTIRQAYIDNLNFANAVAERPYEQYSGPRVAALNQDQQAAFQGVRDLQGQYQPLLNQAAGAAGSVIGQQAPQIGYNPYNAQGYTAQNAQLGNLGAASMATGVGYNPALSQFNQLGQAQNAQAAGINRGDVRSINAQGFLQGDVSQYTNPYTSEVVNTSLNDIDRARQLQQQQINAQAASRGAYGGSRQAIAESENSRNYLDQQARTAAQLRNQGFDTASNLLQGDITRNLQAQQANQGADINVAGQNAGFQQQTGLANQQANNQFALQNFSTQNQNNQFNAGLQNQAAQFGASAQNTASLANQAANNQFSLQNFASQNALNQFNAGNQNQAAQFGASAGNQAGLTNAGQDLAAQQANAQNFLSGNQMNLSAANQLAGLAGQGQQFGLNAANALNTIGGQQQAQVQANYNTAQQDFQNQFNYPLQQLQIRSAALGVQPYGGDRATQTPQNTNNLATTLGALGAGTSILNNLGLGSAAGSFLGGLGSSALSGLGGLFGSSSGSSGLPVLGQGFDPNQSF